MFKQNKKILLLVAADSYLPHSVKIWETLQESNWEVQIAFCFYGCQKLISKRQIERFGASEIPTSKHTYDLANLDQLTNAACDFNAVFLGLPGHYTRDILKKIRCKNLSNQNNYTITVSAFPGILYYIQTYGQWCRCSSDIILFNDKRTLNDYEVACKYLFGIPSSNSLLFGYPTLGKIEWDKENATNLVYIDQNLLPYRYSDRKELYKKIISLGIKKKYKKIIFVGRNLLSENSNHKVNHSNHLDSIISEIRKDFSSSPIEISYDPPSLSLRNCALCLGITSTVLLEAIYAGIPTAPINTKGVTGKFNGAKLFQKTDFSRSIEELLDNRSISLPSDKWLDDNLEATTPSTQSDFIEHLEKAYNTLDKNLILTNYPKISVPLSVMKIICRAYDAYFHFRY